MIAFATFSVVIVFSSLNGVSRRISNSDLVEVTRLWYSAQIFFVAIPLPIIFESISDNGINDLNGNASFGLPRRQSAAIA